MTKKQFFKKYKKTAIGFIGDLGLVGTDKENLNVMLEVLFEFYKLGHKNQYR